MTEASVGEPTLPTAPARAARTVALLVLLGILTGLSEGGTLAIEQHLLHRLTFASPDSYWLAPVAYALIFGLVAIPVAALAWLAPRWGTLRLALVIGLSLMAFSLLSFLFGLKLSRIALLLLSLGVGVQLGRVLAPAAARLGRRLVPAALLLAGLVAVVGAVAVVRGNARRSSAGTLPAPAPSTPNVLVIILDTVRAASLGWYGYDRPTTPRLAEFAAGGVTFDSAYATAPWTLPSHGSMFTGLYHQDLTTDWLAPLDRTPRTLAEAFAAEGYATGGFVANLMYTSRESGLARGFQFYQDFKLSRRQLLLSATLYGTALDWWQGTRRARRDNDRKDGPRVTAEFLDWLDRRQPGRFFVFLNYFDAHMPLPRVRPGSAWDSQRPMVDRYDAAIARTDAYLGAVLDSLAARGLLESTLVVISSDHGTHVGEHGLTEHGNSLYHPLLHVPLVLRGPGLPAGRRIGRAVSLRDLAETVRAAAGLARTAPFPGTSLVGLWSGQPTGVPSPLLAQVTKGINTPPEEPASLGTMNTVMASGHHYILGGIGQEQLFDLTVDPGELGNLAADPGRLPLLEALRDSLRQLKRPGWGGAPEVPARGTPGATGS